jgi:prepilin-type processing-associated H-X9-DG protein
LIEVMVVIAIVGLIAGLLLPVLAQAKRITMSISCANKVGQWALALIMYSADHQDKFPADETSRMPINAGREPSVSGQNFLARHDLKANVVFTDGHFESIASNILNRTRSLDSSAAPEWATNQLGYWYPNPNMKK